MRVSVRALHAGMIRASIQPEGTVEEKKKEKFRSSLSSDLLRPPNSRFETPKTYQFQQGLLPHSYGSGAKGMPKLTEWMKCTTDLINSVGFTPVSNSFFLIFYSFF